MKPLALVLIVAAAFAAGGYWVGQRGAHAPAPEVAKAAPEATRGAQAVAKAEPSERKVLYWHDPMVPGQRFDKPGKSPFMNMDLVPVYADDRVGEGGVSVSSRVRQSLGIRTAAAQLTELRDDVTAVGYVQADERRIARAEVRTQGWVERLHVRAVNDPVRAGQVLAEIYSPELLQAQEEYLLARRMAQANAADEPLARATRRRLELLGMAAADIDALDASGAASRRVPLHAPISGVVTELGVREGAMVQAGMAAFTLTDLSSVWLTLEVPEAQAASLRLGQSASASVQNLSGRTFTGRIDYVYPELNPQTRTVKARVALANPGLALKPGMFAQVSLASASRKVLTIPSEAVIQTGTRSVVIIAGNGEHFRAATVQLGAESGGRTEVIAGLKAGEHVVASGQFLIDSEASLRGALSRLESGGADAPAAGPVERYRSAGRVTDLHIAKGHVEIAHEPIPALKWPAMTMEFVVADRPALRALKRGDRVEFEMRAKPTAENEWVIEKIQRKATP